MPTLFDPLRLGDLDLPNRVIMAPLTRLRADVQRERERAWRLERADGIAVVGELAGSHADEGSVRQLDDNRG